MTSTQMSPLNTPARGKSALSKSSYQAMPEASCKHLARTPQDNASAPAPGPSFHLIGTIDSSFHHF